MGVIGRRRLVEGQRLGEADRAGSQRLGAACAEQSACLGVMGVALVEVGDQDAGIEDDHAGQSSRRRSSSPGS